jgi:antitoxin component HigA of HigAB toxin-antitoxin module
MSMKVEPIKNVPSYRRALKGIDRLFGAQPNTP